MRQRQMLAGESVVNEWDVGKGGESLVLSNVRVWIESEAGGVYTMTSIPLDEVQWSGLRGQHSIAWLILAGGFALLGGVGAVGLDMPSALGVGLLFAALFVLAYFATRSVQLTIGSGLATIRTTIRGGAEQRGRALAFLDQVEHGAMQLRARA